MCARVVLVPAHCSFMYEAVWIFVLKLCNACIALLTCCHSCVPGCSLALKIMRLTFVPDFGCVL